jgi:CMP-N-acetylneuraminic acid synthetase
VRCELAEPCPPGAVLGLIPARGGSKRVKRKNLQMLGPLSLLGWAIDTGSRARYINRLVVSSEDEEILSYTSECWGVEVLERPAEIATDEADLYGVIRHALDSVGDSFAAVCLLQPTSPFRTAMDVDHCIETWQNCRLPAVLSIEEGKSVPNGAIYVACAEWLRNGGTFVAPGMGVYWMLAEHSLDIDTEADLARARQYLEEEIIA